MTKHAVNNSNTSIMVVGDVHRGFARFDAWLSSLRPRLVLQCGDLGYWPRSPGARLADGSLSPPPGLHSNGSRIFFCDGNHEDHPALRAKGVGAEVYPNVCHMPRGSTLKLPDGRRVLFVGGATSVDRHLRTPGLDWFEEEALSMADLKMLPDVPIDIVVSHTCPLDFGIADQRLHGEDPTRILLSLVLTRYRPRWWFFGHFHMARTGVSQGCRWTALSKIGDPGWACPLPPPEHAHADA